MDGRVRVKPLRPVCSAAGLPARRRPERLRFQITYTRQGGGDVSRRPGREAANG